MSPMAATKREIDERAHPYRVIAERLEFHLRQVGPPQSVAASLEKAKEALMSSVTELEVTLGEPKHADGTERNVNAGT